MTAIIVVAVVLFAVSLPLFGWIFRRKAWWFGEKWETHLAVFESALAVGALAGGVAWYIVARPDAAKINVDLTAAGYGIGDDRALIVSELSIANVGGSLLKVRENRYRLFVQQVTPVSGPVLEEFPAGQEVVYPIPIQGGDKWVLLARWDERLDSDIESGESEHLYNRVIVPCQRDLRVYITAWVQNPRGANLLEGGERVLNVVKQFPLDLTQVCTSSNRRRR